MSFLETLRSLPQDTLTVLGMFLILGIGLLLIGLAAWTGEK